MMAESARWGGPVHGRAMGQGGATDRSKAADLQPSVRIGPCRAGHADGLHGEKRKERSGPGERERGGVLGQRGERFDVFLEILGNSI